MKVIETIINTANLDELKAALNNIGIEKIMVSHLVNNSRKKGRDVLHWGADYMFGLMTKIKVEIIAADELVGRVIETIGEIARTDSKRDCRILIHPFVEASI